MAKRIRDFPTGLNMNVMIMYQEHNPDNPIAAPWYFVPKYNDNLGTFREILCIAQENKNNKDEIQGHANALAAIKASRDGEEDVAVEPGIAKQLEEARDIERRRIARRVQMATYMRLARQKEKDLKAKRTKEAEQQAILCDARMEAKDEEQAKRYYEEKEKEIDRHIIPMSAGGWTDDQAVALLESLIAPAGMADFQKVKSRLHTNNNK